jgi:hypothetical protein
MDSIQQSPQEIPDGFCQCGCGQRTSLAPQTVRTQGIVKGQPRRYIRGHRGQGQTLCTCETCGKLFSVDTSRVLAHGVRYCSRACYIAASEKVERHCLQCGKAIILNACDLKLAYRGKYCSRECYRAGRWPNPRREKPRRAPRVEIICATCGKPFSIAPSTARLGTKKYCSKACYTTAQSDPSHFWARVEKTETCWLWQGACDVDGYGKFAGMRAHRYAYNLVHGPIPEGLYVLHTCDVRNCVRDEHLWLGDTNANMADMVAKDRQAKGNLKQPRQQHKQRVDLTTEQVAQVRARWALGGTSTYKLGREFNVSPATVGNIVNSRSRVHSWSTSCLMRR